MLNVGFGELLLVFFVATCVLGPKRVPEVTKLGFNYFITAKKMLYKLQQELAKIDIK